MPKASPLQESFSTGEISPLLLGRVGMDRYKAALKICLNYIPTIQGGLTRRPGTTFVAETKGNAIARMIPFEFSTTQAYIIEFTNQKIRFYKDHGQILNLALAPYEIDSPYLQADLFDLKYTQSDDVLYIVHPDYPPAKLERFAHANWTLSVIDFLDGPYLAVNTTTTTLTPSASTGAGITVTAGPSTTITNAANNGSGLIRITSVAHGLASDQKLRITGVLGTVEANGAWKINVIDADTYDLKGSVFTNAYISGGTANPAVFELTDIGRLVRTKEGAVWGYFKVTAVTNEYTVTADVIKDLTNNSAKLNWRLGVWSEALGYPSAVTFHEDRLFFGGSASFPQRLDGSNTGDYENFAPSDTAGTITASNAVSFSLNSNDVNATEWIAADEKGMLSGTVGGEWVVRASSLSEALSPTNVSAKRATSYGSNGVQPVSVGKAVLFVQRAGQKLREMTYFFDVDGFRATDLTVLSEHITESGIKQIAYQKEPQSLIWCVRNDGVLACMTYERDLDNVKVGWSRQILGGRSDLANTNAQVESVATIPSPDGQSNELWVVVKRTVNGTVKRYVEYMAKIFQDSDLQRDAFFVDSGLTLDNPITVTAITQANPAVVTAAGHGLANGDKLNLSMIKGMTDLNGVNFVIANVTINNFSLRNVDNTADINSTAMPAYVSGGEARKRVTNIAGLAHLEGETVSILSDGASLPDQVVTGGAIVLSTPAAVVHVGLGYNSDAQMVRQEAGAADGTALGKTRRTQRMGMLLHRSLGLKVGMGFDKLTELTFRTSADPMTRAPGLFSGIISEDIEADYDFQNEFCWRQSQPLPSTILAVMPQITTQDRG